MDITGIKFPFGFKRGRVALSRNEQHLKESIMQIIGTAKGEYVMLPAFGSGVHRRVFDPVNVVALVDGDIREAIRIWEPRVEILKVSAGLEHSDLGTVGIAVEFRMKGQREPIRADMTVGR